jgi:hypothetical protein
MRSWWYDDIDIETLYSDEGYSSMNQFIGYTAEFEIATPCNGFNELMTLTPGFDGVNAVGSTIYNERKEISFNNTIIL